MPEQTQTISLQASAPQAKARPLTWWRRLTQVITLAIMGQWSFYGVFRCPFIVPYVSCENCPVLTCHGRLFTMFWGFWLAMPLLLILFGRAFCGWACPAGLVNQLLGKLAPAKLSRNKALRRLAPWTLFIALAAALVVWLGLGQPREVVPIRVGDFWQSVSLTFAHAFPFWLVRTIVVLGLMAFSLVVANFWCRYACPTGGALEALKRFSIYKVYKTEACNDCDKCRKVCPMSTRPSETNCTNCGDCLGSCPQGAIQVGRPGGKS